MKHMWLLDDKSGGFIRIVCSDHDRHINHVGYRA